MRILLSLLCLVLAGAAMPALARTSGEVQIGGILREATMEGLTGPSRKLSEFRGRPLIINVWASYCGPCREEMASLERLHRRYGDKRLAVIGISTDDYQENAQWFLRQAKTTFSHFIDNKLLLENMLGADRLPLTLLVDADGKVLAKFYGARDWDGPEALAEIRRYFGLKG